MKMKRRLVAALLLGPTLLIGYASLTYAHGERAQEAFLRMQTVGWFDVKYSADTVKQGEPWNVSGTLKILETWPKTLDEPETAYVGVSAPGPIAIMKERVINGKPAPHSIFVKRGDVLEFQMTLQGRRPGRWHIHPIIAIEGAGSLLGPGQWLTVEEVPGGFSFPLTLFNVKEVNVEDYGLNLVMITSLIGLVIGLWFMWHWTGPRATITRLAVTNLIPLHDIGEDFGLITKRDQRYMNLFAILAIVLLVAGYAYSEVVYPERIPLQVIRFEPPKLPEVPVFAEAKVAGPALYDVDQTSLELPIQITNMGNSPITLANFTTSTVTFSSNPAADASRLAVEPGNVIGANETKTLKLTMRDQLWYTERLVPIGEAQMVMTGVVTFVNSAGQKNRLTVQAPLRPSSFKKDIRAY